jgi:hypothetical protein
MSLRMKIVTLSAAIVFASGHSSAQNPTMKSAMRDKLVNTQQLLESVVIADFVAIGRSADALSRITDTEMISWQAAAQSEYLKQATFFVLSVRGLREAAANRDINAAMLEYTTLVSSCIRCHTHVRSSKRVSFEPPTRR